MKVVLTRKHAVLALVIFACQCLTLWRISLINDCLGRMPMLAWYFVLTAMATSALGSVVILSHMFELVRKTPKS